MEYQIFDRLSFKQFLRLESSDKVLDEKTIWLFHENLINTKTIADSEYRKIVDASFTLALILRNTLEENKKIKEGSGHELCASKKEKHKKATRTLMNSGQKRIKRRITDTRITRRLMPKQIYS